MAKSKPLVISGPMDAKHVGGVNVMGGVQPSILDSYFDKTMLGPDELPSHTYVATGNSEVPKRSDTIAGTIRRSSLSLRRSYSNLRRNSISHVSETRSTTGSSKHMAMEGSDGVAMRENARPLRTQTSLSRLRQRVGLDRELYESPPVARAVTPEPEAPKPIKKDSPRLRTRKPLPRSVSDGSSKYPGTKQPASSISIQRKPSTVHRNVSTVHRNPSSASYQPIARSMTAPSASKRPVNPERVDSGTAIALDKVPVQKRPLPFQEIMAVKDLAERMTMYKKTREYWAYADHGLIDWTGRASGPKTAHSRT